MEKLNPTVFEHYKAISRFHVSGTHKVRVLQKLSERVKRKFSKLSQLLGYKERKVRLVVYTIQKCRREGQKDLLHFSQLLCSCFKLFLRFFTTQYRKFIFISFSSNHFMGVIIYGSSFQIFFISFTTYNSNYCTLSID